MVSAVEYKVPSDSYIRLKYSWDMILCLDDFINCVNLHKKDLKNPRNTGLMKFRRDFYKDTEFNPAGVLKDYIYLEANSFFECAKMLKSSKGVRMPDLPTYLKELKNFRDVMVGHRDKKRESKFPEGWMMLQEEIQKLIPVKKLIKDINDYFQSLVDSPNKRTI